MNNTNIFGQTLLNGGTVTGEIINKAKDGRIIPVAGTNSPILDENGKILGFLAVHQDISERKKSEEEIKDRNEYLAVLNEIMSLAGQTLDIHSILKTVLEKILQSTGFDGGLITMFNASRGKLERAVRIGMPGQSPADPAEGLDHSLCNYVFDYTTGFNHSKPGSRSTSGCGRRSTSRSSWLYWHPFVI